MDQNAPVPHHSEVQVETYDRPTYPKTPPTLTPPPSGRRRQRARRRGPRWFVWLIGCVLAVVLIALLACALVGGLVVGIVFKLANEVTASATSTQSFVVSDIPALDIHNAAGRVQVQSGAPGVVSVQITKNTRDTSQSAAQAGLDTITVTATQTGNLITITTDFQDASFFASSSTVNLLITVPPTANIAADVTAGNIEVDGVSGLLEITGDAGTATLQDVATADGSRIHLTTGSVILRGVIPTNATVDIAVSTGNVTLQLPADTQTRLDARTNIGAIQINGWPLAPTRMNSVGAVANGALGAQPSGTLHIRVDTGDITVSQL